MSLAEGAMAPSPAMMTGLPKPLAPPSPPATRRSRAMLELAEQLAQKAEAPSSPIVEQQQQEVPAVSPTPQFFAASPGRAPTLEEIKREDVSMMKNLAPSVYDGACGEREREKEASVFSLFSTFFLSPLASLALSNQNSFRPLLPPPTSRSDLQEPPVLGPQAAGRQGGLGFRAGA